MLGTLTRGLTIEDAELLENNFNDLLKLQIEQGHITDHDFDSLGFPDDIGTDGTVTKRYSDNDSRKRACQLNHASANLRRKYDIIRHQQIKHEKKMTSFRRVEKVILENEKCEKKLLEKLLQNGLQNISDASLSHFGQCTASELTNFIIVRVLVKHDTVSKQIYLKDQNISKLPNKKHLANAEIGEDWRRLSNLAGFQAKRH